MNFLNSALINCIILIFAFDFFDLRQACQPRSTIIVIAELLVDLLSVSVLIVVPQPFMIWLLTFASSCCCCVLLVLRPTLLDKNYNIPVILKKKKKNLAF